jgi:predicted nucleic acid-binding protein
MLPVTLIDTNILLDLVMEDPTWAEWSQRQVESATLRGNLYVNDPVYAELSVRFQSVEAVDDMLLTARIDLLPMPRSALFLAGKVFQRYRASGGHAPACYPISSSARKQPCWAFPC